MTPAEHERLRVAVRALERARRALVEALGEPPVDHPDDHPVTALDVALHHADEAVRDATPYYVKAPRRRR